jgi:CDP-glycerol glycerophosphotransferase
MNKLQYFLWKIKDVKPEDYLAVFPMVTGEIVSLFYKKKYKDYWIICEDPKEARDNGYWLFKYIREQHPEQKIIYLINKDSVDYYKVAKLGQCVQYGSLKHWILYFTTRFNISSQKGGKPNAALCAFFELNGKFKPHNIFLQHGVIINDLVWLHADRSCIETFITSAVSEYKFVRDVYGYKPGVVQRTGLPRFDNLHDNKIIKNQILIMPSWRAWFTEASSRADESDANFANSEYLIRWKEILNSDELKKLIDKYHLKVVFYPHRNMQHFLSFFHDVKAYITIASYRDYDVQNLLKESEMMITDYSSVFFDMIYMKKPVLFYQFDEEKFRKQQYEKGYFDYHNNSFGKSFNDYKSVVMELENIIKDDYKVDEAFLKAHDEYFPYFDTNNSERIYRLLKGKESRD